MEQDIAQHRASVTNLERDWHYYCHLRTDVNKILKSEKAQWQIKKLKSMGNDTGSVWKNLKDWFGWKQHGPPTQLSHRGNIYTKPADLSRIMNEQFIDKVNNHVDNLSPPLSDLFAPVEKFMKFKTCSLELNQVEKIIMNMRSSSSCGLDTIIMKFGQYMDVHKNDFSIISF